MRFNGTLVVELVDGTAEKFSDEVETSKKKWGAYRRWTHSMEKQWDDSLVVTRHIEETTHGWYYDRDRVDQEWSEVVGHFPAGTWRKARFKD